jgi:hypothetical protein
VNTEADWAVEYKDLAAEFDAYRWIFEQIATKRDPLVYFVHTQHGEQADAKWMMQVFQDCRFKL